MVYQPTRYTWTGNARYGVDAQVVGERLEKLSANGPLTPQRVVEDAKPKSSPLHKVFEWDDTKAAEAYRVTQARQLIRSVAVVYDTPESTEGQVRAYVSVTADETARSYMPTAHVMSEAALRRQAFQSIKDELKRLKVKMREFEEFSAVVNAIEELAA